MDDTAEAKTASSTTILENLAHAIQHSGAEIDANAEIAALSSEDFASWANADTNFILLQREK
jgi:hypothetical protein